MSIDFRHPRTHGPATSSPAHFHEFYVTGRQQQARDIKATSMADTSGMQQPQPSPEHDPHDHDGNDHARTGSKTMIISPNLEAALEFDEKTRGSLDAPTSPGIVNAWMRSSRDSLVAGTSLPPPPRPKSSQGSIGRARSPPLSPSVSLSGLRLDPAEPQSASATKVSATLNPYINPPPRLPLLLTEDSMYRTHSRTPSLPERLVSIWPPEGARTSESSPRSEHAPSPVVISSPESGCTPTTSPETRTGFQKHVRYWSALPKVGVEKLVKGKARRAEAKVGRDGARRASDAELLAVCDREQQAVKASKESPPMMRQFLKTFERRASTVSMEDVSRSAPSSPIVSGEDARMQRRDSVGGGWERARMEEGAASTVDRSDLRRRAPPSHRAANTTSSSSLPPTATTPTTDRASLASVASSASSHDPPPTPSDPRISISSTLYQASNCSVDYSPRLFNSPLYPAHHPHNTSGRPNMDHSDTESFMDLTSPTFTPRSPEFASNASFASMVDVPRRSTDSDASHRSPTPLLAPSAPKPPVPTTPKPTFSKRSKSAQPPLSRKPKPGDSPVTQEAAYGADLPPTTNFLNPHERAERVRKARKIAQLLGHAPAAVESLAISHVAYEANGPTLKGAALLSAASATAVAVGPVIDISRQSMKKLQHQRGAVSMSVAPAEHLPAAVAAEATTTQDAIRYPSLASRRHSSPLSPQTFSFADVSSAEDHRSSDTESSRPSSVVIEIGSQQGVADSDWSSHTGHRSGGGPTSPTSFMDLSEEEVVADGASSIITVETPRADRRPGLLSSAASVYSFTSEQLEEEERRRKRDKVAKLHRFLGSRVPTDLVLNQLSIETSVPLPPPLPVTPVTPVERTGRPEEMDPEARKVWLRRRRSSSAAELRGTWSEDIDRLKEELNDREKAQNVRRAVKMQQYFGVQPPQTLYHTRSAPSHAEAQLAAIAAAARQALTPGAPTSPRNVNQSAYGRRYSKKPNSRPSTAESTQPLIGGEDPPHPFSEIYEHYRHSLNSLNDIIDRDDRESLERLHGFIHGDTTEEPPLREFTRQPAVEEEAEEPTTPKAIRRRSLPTRASVTSLSSEFSVMTTTTVSAEEKTFQARRKRAAKLTQFFGVDYRDLMSEIIDSIEQGLQEESGRGTLRPDEVQELLQKLRKLKVKRNSLFTLTTS